jgi:hypothetical protein
MAGIVARCDNFVRGADSEPRANWPNLIRRASGNTRRYDEGRFGSTFWSIGRLNDVATAVVAVEPVSAHSAILRKDAAMGQVGHACIASAETNRNSFSVVPLAA